MKIEERIGEIARVPVLLIASDYDGTLAPLVEDPDEAVPRREAIVALRRLAELPNTHVAVISGRSLAELARLSGLPEEVRLVGSHGSEFDQDFSHTLAPELVTRRDELERDLAAIATDAPGALVESKPASVAFHYRNAERKIGEAALARVMDGPGTRPGVFLKHGKMVLELAVVPTSKGAALERIRGQVGASAAVFLGDDVTDEDAFATMGGPDLAVKVGPGESCAPYRVDDPQDIARLLARLCEERLEWLAGGAATPIEHHGFLSDNRTLALVTPDARLTWLCLPRADSPSMFAELLGGPTAGFFAVGPADTDAGTPTQRYVGDTLLLETAWRGLSVTDLLDCGDGRAFRRAGRVDLLRILRGRGRARLEIAPRLDFGRMPARIEVEPDGLRVVGGPDPIVLRAPGVAWTLREEGGRTVALAEVELEGPDGELALELRYGTADLGPTHLLPRERAAATAAYWSRWVEDLRPPAVARDLVVRSALALKGLCHGPTGAILAAGTTSLPEHIGGVRNWDYRFCWPRDASLAAAALVRIGSTSEAMAFLDWLLGVCQELVSPAQLKPLYAVDRGSVHAEAEIGELAGYRGSRPVRVGNTAVHQVQLDVFGPIVDLVARLFRADAPLSTEHWRLVEGMAEAVVERWREPDHGIWEERIAPLHHVHSKVMGWQTLDRAAALARTFRGQRRLDWEGERDAIRADVLAHGFSDQIGGFRAAYGGDAVDAATLSVGLSGLLPADDPRFLGTVEAVERTLLRGPTVYRYHHEDGLPGNEGGFHICTAWLVEAYLAVGRRDDARALFERWTACAGPTGLLPEQFDPADGTALGNHPQAYSHTGLIENACSLAELA
jgi:trehalose-phosphatase